MVQINSPQPKEVEIHTDVPMSFRELPTPIVKDQAQQYKPLSLVPLSTIETDRAIQTISAMPSHGQAGAIVVDLSTPDTPSPHAIHSETEVQATEASNAEPTGMDFAEQDFEIPSLEPSNVHSGISTMAIFEDQVNSLPQQVILFYFELEYLNTLVSNSDFVFSSVGN